MPSRFHYKWEYELLTPGTLMSLALQAATLTFEKVIADPDNLDRTLQVATDGWEIIIRLFKITTLNTTLATYHFTPTPEQQNFHRIPGGIVPFVKG